MAGYSGTPLAKKLGIMEGARVLMLGAPSAFSLGVVPIGSAITKTVPKARNVDVALVFVKEKRALKAAFARASKVVTESGGVWIAWPKKSSGVATDITEDVLRDAILPTGYVDNKVCAVDETWSGLRFVLRKELRSQKR
jgi:hypothetical protein